MAFDASVGAEGRELRHVLLRRTATEFRRARLIRAASLLLVVFAAPLTVWSYIDEGYASPTFLTLFVGILLVALNPLVLSRGASHRWVGTLLTVEILVALAILSHQNGGLRSAAVYWHLPIPLLAAYLVGPWLTIATALAITLEVVVFMVLQEAGYRFPHPLDPTQMLHWQVTAVASAAAFIGLLSVVHEKERNRSEQLIAKLERRLRTLVSSAPLALFVFDADKRLDMVMGQAVDGLSEDARPLAGKALGELGTRMAGLEGPVRQAFGGEEVRALVQLGGRSMELACVPVHETSKPGARGVIAVALDVTARTHMEHQLFQADRLASVGTLAAGIAHEINNPLSFVLNNLDFSIDRLRDLSHGYELADVQEALRDARDGADRIQHAAAELKVFSRKEDLRIRPVNLRDVIDTALKLTGNELRHQAKVRLDLGSAPRVAATEAHLGQVFVNLLINAAQSIDPGSPDANEIRLSLSTTDDGSALVEVSDTGRGIPEEDRQRIFEPFFTTREAGTGLGLAVCQKILARFGGKIEVESELGKGATFRCLLPAMTQAEVEASLRPPSRGESAERAAILIIDDEELVRRSLKRSLRGHDVTMAKDGEEGVAAYGSTRFDIVLCDLMMTKVSGQQVFERLVEMDPSARDRIIMMTGGAFTRPAQEFVANVGVPVLQKPIDVPHLREVIRDRLAHVNGEAHAP